MCQSRSVLVAAPTGSGKTIVAKFAIQLALSRGSKAVYTSPLKALSNEKFRELCEELGPEHVGLLTGDVSIRPRAEVLVMTTEVLRNMLYQNDPEIDLISHVVLDEIHYLQDPARGSTWEEVILMLPQHVRIVCLSATISNTGEFLGWLRAVRGDVQCVSRYDRPVPLEVLYCYEDSRTGKARLRRLWARGSKTRPNPSLTKALSARHGRRDRYALVPHRLDVLDALYEAGLMPTIYFIFSRQGCERAVQMVASEGISLLGESERREVEKVALERTAAFSDAELSVLDFGRFLDGLLRGVAAHHGGMLHQFKEIVEMLFSRGLLRVVFATETLSLGIDMPARSVVLESFYKFDGISHKLLTPSEFTQLSGRAGRRGKDEIGYAVVVHSPWLPLEHVASTARSTKFKLVSSFKPGYNMVANMIFKYPTKAEAEKILGSSYAAYQSRPGGRRGGHFFPSASELVAEFRRYREVLARLGYLRGEWQLAEKGEILAGIYTDRDIAFVEWLARSEADHHDIPVLSAIISGFVSDEVGPDERVDYRYFRNRKLREEASKVEEVVSDVTKVEQEIFFAQKTPLPDFAYALAAMRWAKSNDPTALLETSKGPGDVVRHLRRIIDLARQAHEATRKREFELLATALDVGIVSSAVPGE